MKRTFKEVFEEYKVKIGKDVSQRELSEILGWSTTKVSQMINGTYPSNVEEETEYATDILLGEKPERVSEREFQPIKIKRDVIVSTPSFRNVYTLGESLLDPQSFNAASIGLVTGRAGLGKTTALKRFAVEHDNCVYLLYQGFNRSQLFRAIAYELVKRNSNSYFTNLQIIQNVTRLDRKLIIIDEADRMPIKLLEDLRVLNEGGSVPLVICGEPVLNDMVASADRIFSRIRKPRVSFQNLEPASLLSLYREAAGLDPARTVIEGLVSLSGADFRVAANDMQEIVAMMNASRYPELTGKVFNEYRRRSSNGNIQYSDTF